MKTQPLAARCVVVMVILQCILLQVNGLSRSQLYNHVLEKSDPLVSPIDRSSDTLDIYFRMFLFSINKVDEKAQLLSLTLETFAIWPNKYMVWKPSNYNDIRYIKLPVQQIWTPKTVCIQNEILANKCLVSEDSTAVVNSYGFITVISFSDISISCKMNLKYFPFDEQICTVKYVDRMPFIENIRFQKYKGGEVDLSDFTEHVEWTLINASLEVKKVFNITLQYEHLLIHIQLKRKSFLPVCNNLLPVWILSTLNVFCFLIPATSGEKLSTCIAIFLTFAVFLTMMKDFMPQASDEISYFLVYMFTQLTVSGLVVILEIIVLHVHHQDEELERTGSEVSTNLEKHCLSEKIKFKSKSNCCHSENNRSPQIRSQTLDKIFCILITGINVISLSVYLMLTLLQN